MDDSKQPAVGCIQVSDPQKQILQGSETGRGCRKSSDMCAPKSHLLSTSSHFYLLLTSKNRILIFLISMLTCAAVCMMILTSMQCCAQIQTREEGFVEEQSRRVIAACWGPGREGSPLTTLVALDEAGNLVEVLSLPAFSGPLRNRRGYLADIPPTIPTHLRQIYKAQVKISRFPCQD